MCGREREIEKGGGRERKEKRKGDFHKHSSIISTPINYIYQLPTHQLDINIVVAEINDNVSQ